MLYFVLLKSFVTRCLSLKKGKLHMNTSALLVLKDCASRTIHLKASTKLIALGIFCFISAVLTERFSCSDILCLTAVLAPAAALVDTGMKILIPTCSPGATLLKAPSKLIALNKLTTEAMLEEELVTPSFAGIFSLASLAATTHRLSDKIPFVFGIGVRGTHCSKSHHEEERGKDFLGHRVHETSQELSLVVMM